MSTETQTRTGVYEAMFLANQAAAASFGDLVAHINNLLGRANAEVIAMKKWDERRLAYEIDKQKRGVYILAYISCPTDMVAHLERDVQISDQLLRVLITSAEHLTEEEMKAHDDRTGLETEAKLKAEQGESVQDAGSGKAARFGAPAAEERAQTEAAKEQREPQPEAQSEPKPDAEASDGAQKGDEPGDGEPKQD